jgi:16S rRNA (guanine966-N2)-methyltransferase
MLGPEGADGRRVLDLYAGTGNMGIEALMRGAEWTEFIEINERRCREIREVLERLRLTDRSRVHRGDVAKVTDRLEGPFDIVFIDPPYGEDPFEKVMQALEENDVLADEAIVFAEHSTRMTLPEQLPGVWLQQRKRYGDTAVTVYERNPDGSASSPTRSG